MFNKKYRSDIDGLRAIAVLLVVFYHAKIFGFSGGFIGVDVFFVISGYLITQHLVSEIWEKGRISLTSFYSKRFRRLYPALLFVISIVLIVWALFLLGVPEETGKLYKSMLYSLIGIGNIYFKHVSGGYFETSSDEFPLLHMWSLSDEEQFYVMWPILISLGFYSLKKNKTKEAFKKRIKKTLIIVITLSFLFCLYLLNRSFTPAAFYWMPARAWELGAGALLVFYTDNFDHLLGKMTAFSKEVILEFMTLAGLLMILLSGIFWAHKYTFPGTGAVLPVAGAVLLILAGSSSYKAKTGLVYNNKFFVEIGLLSYGIYLWHWPFLAMLKVWAIGEETSLLMRCVIIIASILLAKVTLVFVEKPLREGKLLKNKTDTQVIAIFVSASLVLIVSGFLITKFEKKIYASEGNEFYSLVSERTSFREPCMNKLDKIGSPECAIPASKFPDVNVSVWGDSIGYAIYPMIEEFAREKGIGSILYSNTSKAPFVFNPELFYNGSQKETDESNKANEMVFEDIRLKIKNEPRIQRSIVITPYWHYYLGKSKIQLNSNFVFIDRDKTAEGSLMVLGESLEKTLVELKSIGIHKILILLPYPTFRYHVLKCRRRSSKSCDTDRELFDNYRKAVIEMVKTKVAGLDYVKLVDPANYFCNDKVCPQVMTVNNRQIPVVHDDTHPSSEASRYLGTKIQKELNWLISR